MVKSNIPANDKYELVLDFDTVLGLKLAEVTTEKIEIPQQILELAQKREQLRKEGKYQEADDIRKKIEGKGYTLIDSKKGSTIKFSN